MYSDPSHGPRESPEALDEESLRALFEHSLDALLLTAPTGEILAANPAACALVGYTDDEIRRLGRAGVVDPSDPRLPEAIAERRRTGRFRGELTLIHRDGRRIPVEISSAVFRNGSGRELTSMVIRDQTERQQELDAERERARAALAKERMELALERQRLRAMLELLPVGVWIADRDGRLAESNPAAARIWGGQAPASLHWERYHDEYRAWWPDGRPVGRGEWGMARALRGEASGPEEVEIEGFDGRRRTILNYGVPIRDDEGGVVGAVAVSVDVTERKAAEQEARRARDEAEEANRAKSQFLATMSHEIRTPLNAIGGYVDLMEVGINGALSEAHQQYLSRIRASARHLTMLVSDILDLSKIEAGQMEVEREPTHLLPVLEEAVSVVRPILERKGLRFTQDFACEPHTRFWGDPDRVRQILVNLLSNAAKFTPEGKIRLRCRVGVAAPPEVDAAAPGPWIALEVEDTGVGIDAAHHRAIFAPFTQVDGSYARRQTGTGLGLAISRSLARLMSGEITVESVPGKGSRFVLWLTETTDEQEPPERRSGGERRSHADRRSGADRRQA